LVFGQILSRDYMGWNISDTLWGKKSRKKRVCVCEIARARARACVRMYVCVCLINNNIYVHIMFGNKYIKITFAKTIYTHNNISISVRHQAVLETISIIGMQNTVHYLNINFCLKLILVFFYIPTIARSTNALSFCICNVARKKNRALSTSTNIARNIAYCRLKIWQIKCSFSFQ